MKVPVWARDMDDAHSVFHSYCESAEAFRAKLAADPATISVSEMEPMKDGRITIVAKEKAPSGVERHRQYIVGDTAKS